MWFDGREDERETPAQGKAKPKAPIGVAVFARPAAGSPHGLPAGTHLTKRPGLVRLQDLVEVTLPETQLEAMTHAQLLETMQDVTEQHARLLEMAQNMLQLQERVKRRL